MKVKLNINNLDCANCARKIEEELNNNPKLNNVRVNFNTSKLTYESNENITVSQLNKLIKKIEPESTVSKEEIEKKDNKIVLKLIFTVLGIIGIYVPFNNIINVILIVLSYIVLLSNPFINAIKLLKNKIIDENALIVISCIGAYFVNQKSEGLMVIILYTIGKCLESKAINNSRKSIKEIINIKQVYANKKEQDKYVEIKVEDIKVGDILIVKKGERIPVDGIVVKGSTLLDTSSLTGESDLFKVDIDSKVLSSSINTNDIIEMKATSPFSNSTVSKILELVEDATDKKATTETFVNKISKIYTPVVLLLALLVAVLLPIFTSLTYQESIYRGLTFLVISCPCAIVISVPLSYFTGIGIASENGILVKGSNYLDNLSHLKKIIFDKTGTLTSGTFTVSKLEIYNDKYSEENIINIMTKGESLSNHPIAKSIMNLSNKTIDNNDITDYKEISGKGITYKLDNHIINIGNKNMCDCDKDVDIHLNIDGEHVASLTINDGIKDNTYQVIKYLKNNNIKTYMFTGDKKSVADAIGTKIGIDIVKSEMLPTDKYSEYEKIEKNEIVAFVGDGVNDAPVLKRATIGISMGSIGQEGAIEASDIVIMNDDLNKIPLAISISKYTNFIIKQNLLFAVIVKISILLLSVFGIANMWEAVFADTGVTVLTIINSLRIISKYKIKR